MNNDVNSEQTVEEIDSTTEKSNTEKRKKVIIIASSIAVLCVAFVIVLITVIIPKSKLHNLSKKMAKKISTTEVGEDITFGKYEQDNNTSNGKEDIEWIILAKENGKTLLISKYGLDVQQYNTDKGSVTWENCTLRQWLNDTFINDAFNADERTMIQNTYLPSENNPKYGTDSGNDTNDKIFVLSLTEAQKYFTTNESRMCHPTAFAKANANGEWRNEGFCRWWLRTPGISQEYTSDVTEDGNINYLLGKFVDADWETYSFPDFSMILSGDAVRPAMWIDLES